MLEMLSKSRRVIGVKQTTRAIREGIALRVFVAEDAESRLTDPVCALCRESGVELTRVETMRELGQACGIEVGAATAALTR